jgi:hypothetical protein
MVLQVRQKLALMAMNSAYSHLEHISTQTQHSDLKWKHHRSG